MQNKGSEALAQAGTALSRSSDLLDPLAIGWTNGTWLAYRSPFRLGWDALCGGNSCGRSCSCACRGPVTWPASTPATRPPRVLASTPQ